MATPRKTAEARRAEITQAALDLLAATAPEQLTTARVAAQVGISQAALFRHFPTKDHLWHAVMREVEARAERAWAKAAEIGGPPRQRLRMLLITQLGLIEQTPAVAALLFTPGRHIAEATVRPAASRIMAGLRGRIVALAGAAAADGALRQRLLPDDVANLLIGVLQGLALRWVQSGRGFDLSGEGDRLIRLELDLLAPCPVREGG